MVKGNKELLHLEMSSSSSLFNMFSLTFVFLYKFESCAYVATH